MRNIFFACVLAVATVACSSVQPASVNSADPALGASASARHQEAVPNPMGKSAADRHTPGNYYPL